MVRLEVPFEGPDVCSRTHGRVGSRRALRCAHTRVSLRGRGFGSEEGVHEGVCVCVCVCVCVDSSACVKHPVRVHVSAHVSKVDQNLQKAPEEMTHEYSQHITATVCSNRFVNFSPSACLRSAVLPWRFLESTKYLLLGCKELYQTQRSCAEADIIFTRNGSVRRPHRNQMNAVNMKA